MADSGELDSMRAIQLVRSVHAPIRQPVGCCRAQSVAVSPGVVTASFASTSKTGSEVFKAIRTSVGSTARRSSHPRRRASAAAMVVSQP